MKSRKGKIEEMTGIVGGNTKLRMIRIVHRDVMAIGPGQRRIELGVEVRNVNRVALDMMVSYTVRIEVVRANDQTEMTEIVVEEDRTMIPTIEHLAMNIPRLHLEVIAEGSSIEEEAEVEEDMGVAEGMAEETITAGDMVGEVDLTEVEVDGEGISKTIMIDH